MIAPPTGAAPDRAGAQDVTAPPHEDREARYDQQMAKVARHLAHAREMLEGGRHGFALLGATPEGQFLLALETLLGALYVPEEEAPDAPTPDPMPAPDAAGAPPTEAEIDRLIDRTRASWARAEDHYPASLDGLGYAAAAREADAAHEVITDLLGALVALRQSAAARTTLADAALARHEAQLARGRVAGRIASRDVGPYDDLWREMQEATKALTRAEQTLWDASAAYAAHVAARQAEEGGGED